MLGNAALPTFRKTGYATLFAMPFIATGACYFDPPTPALQIGATSSVLPIRSRATRACLPS